VRQAAGDFAGAVSDFDWAIRIRPNFFEAYFNRGNAHRDRQKWDAAISDYTKAIDLNPNPDLFFNRGLARALHGERDGAISDLERALALAPSDWTRAGLARQELERLRK